MDENNIGGNDDSRQSLYDEFEAEIVKAGNSEAYFDENDLIEIFDYASDMDDYIVKMEVLLYGARHYPGSEALATRRAWLYSSFGEMEAAADINNRVSNGGVLNRLLSLRADGATDTPETRSTLGEIVDATSDFGDEDIIQLVDYCAENNMLDWIEANRERIESKCSYVPTFLYEYADRAEDLGDLTTAQRLFEELTMMEPFTADFWSRLSNVQIAQGNTEEALASADYALAIDSNYLEALRIKGRAMFRMDSDKKQVAEVFRAALDHPSSNDTDATAYAAIIIEIGRTDEAAKLLEETISRYPMSQMAIDLLMDIDFSRAVPYILNVDKITGFTCDAIETWAKEHITNGRIDIAVNLLKLFRHKFVEAEDISFITELWYFRSMYRDLVDFVEESIGDFSKLSSPNPGAALPYIMSLIRLGESDKALSQIRQHLSEMEASATRHNRLSDLVSKGMYTSSATCIDIGYTSLLRSITNALTANPPLPPDTYDPMLYL